MGKEDIRSEWKRDMHHNYLIINDKGKDRTYFQEKMLAHNKIEGILSFQIHSIDNHRQFHYEVTGYQAISCISNKVPLRLSQVTTLLNHLLAVLKEAKTYLLNTMDFLLLPDYMFIHLPDYKLGLCYYPGYHVLLQEQLVGFLEFLMGCVDYEDKEAVLFVYSLYMKSREDNITIQELKSFLESQEVKVMATNLPDEHSYNRHSELEKVKESQSHIKYCQIKQQNHIESYQMKSQNQIEPYRMKPKNHLESYQVNPQNQTDSFQMKSSIKQNTNDFESNKKNPSKKISHSSANQLHRKNLMHKVTTLLVDAKDRIHKNESEPESRKNDDKKDDKKNDKKKVHNTNIKNEYQYPFIKEKLEQEEEVFYYPMTCYVLFGILAAVCVGIFLYTYQKGFLFQSLQKKIDGLKLLSILTVMGIALWYGYLKIFSKERKQSRIVTKTSYQMPDKEDIFPSLVSEKSNIITEYNGRTKDSLENNRNLNVLTNPILSNSAPSIISREDFLPNIDSEESYNEEECTILLTSFHKECDALIPLEPMKYDTLEIKEYPFFIGTAKNNLGYSLTNTAVSRYHAKLDKVESSFILTDLDSTNGTFVNGRKLIANENFEVKQGDTVSFANISFIFTCLNNYCTE